MKKRQEQFLKCFGKRKTNEWSEINWKAVRVVNRKFYFILKRLSEYDFQQGMKTIQLKKILQELSEFHSGIYSVLLPKNYPLIDAIVELDLAIENILRSVPEQRKELLMQLTAELTQKISPLKNKLENYIMGDNQLLPHKESGC